MKKIVVLVLSILLTSANASFADCIKKDQSELPNFNQKSCQNIFSLINIDFSAFSPRGAATDVSISDDNKNNKPNKPCEIPIANKTEIKNDIKTKTDDTSFFRLDLLKLIKIRIF